MVERHAEIGSRMLESLGLTPAATWVRGHHERWDGTGYPSKLRGHEIPLGARILFVADAYDTMTSDRLYRHGMPREDALQELQACAGTQFDPDVVEALTALV